MMITKQVSIGNETNNDLMEMDCYKEIKEEIEQFPSSDGNIFNMKSIHKSSSKLSAQK